MAAEDLPEYLDEIHQDIAEFYARHADFLEETFVDDQMEAHGYQREPRWKLPDDAGSASGGQQRRSSTRRPTQQQGQQRRGSYFKGSQR